MVMFVLKESQANTVEVCDKIRAAVEVAAREPALAGFDIQDFFIQGDAIRYSLNQVTESGLALTDAPGVIALDTLDGHLVVRVGSGDYRFVTANP